MAELATYHNPLVPGFNPDPSIVYVDGFYFLVTSTFHLFPGLPVYASSYLRDWKLIGHGLHRTEQLSLFYTRTRVMPLDTGFYQVATGGIMAPTIRYHKGKFYIITTNTTREKPDVPNRDNFIISTSDIWSGQWSDPVHFEFNGIDTSLFIDDDERCYVQGSWMMNRVEQPCSTIYQLELDLESGKILSEAQLIWEGHFRYDTEGPHIYKRGDWYYLLAAEGGTFENHKLTMSRSKNIWGPYKNYEHNPILTAEHTKEYVQGVGHGDLFQDHDGDWWAVALGFRNHGGISPLCRETFLTRVDWPEGGWPKVEKARISLVSKKLPTKSMPQTDIASHIVHLRGRRNENYQLLRQHDQDVFQLRPSRISIDDPYGLPTFLGRRQPNLSATAEVVLDLTSAPAHEPLIAGLTLYLDPIRFTYLAFDFDKLQLQFMAQNLAHKFTTRTSHELATGVSSVHLRIEASVDEYQFYFSEGNESRHAGSEETWKMAGSVETSDLYDRCFTGPLFALFTQAASDRNEFVTFRDFHVREGKYLC